MMFFIPHFIPHFYFLHRDAVTRTVTGVANLAHKYGPQIFINRALRFGGTNALKAPRPQSLTLIESGAVVRVGHTEITVRAHRPALVRRIWRRLVGIL